MWYDPLTPNLVYFTFIGLKLISVVWVSLRLRPSFTLSYWQKGEPMSCTIVFLPHSAACRGLCYVLTEAQALKSLCKDLIPQGFPVWLLLIMSLVINARMLSYWSVRMATHKEFSKLPQVVIQRISIDLPIVDFIVFGLCVIHFL